jgi:hypothetical protein
MQQREARRWWRSQVYNNRNDGGAVIDITSDIHGTHSNDVATGPNVQLQRRRSHGTAQRGVVDAYLET